MPETIGRYRPQARSRSESSKGSPGRASGLMLDVMKPEGLVPGVGAAAKALGGRIDVLANNAGWGLVATASPDRGHAIIQQQGALK
jgi:NAD(P)-dependent dehydrogenase (short-subunit alcohol dehydrogenase family)